MASNILGVVGGVLVVLVGRWIYANPKGALYVRSIHSSPDTPFLKLAAKIFGTLAIFIGSYGVAAAAAGLVTERAMVIVPLGLLAGVVGTWFLRPAVKEVPTVEAEVEKAHVRTRQKLLIVVTLGFAVFSMLTVVALLKFGVGRLIPLVTLIQGFALIAAIAAILWLPKRAS